jgi:hypothetical protein
VCMLEDILWRSEWMHDAYKVPNFLGGLVSAKEGCFG